MRRVDIWKELRQAFWKSEKVHQARLNLHEFEGMRCLGSDEWSGVDFHYRKISADTIIDSAPEARCPICRKIVSGIEVRLVRVKKQKFVL